MQLEQQKKRTKTAQLKYEHKVAETSKGGDAIRAVQQHKRLEAKAVNRAEQSITDLTGPEFTAANKHTAMTSDIGGEMVGVEACFRYVAPCSPIFH